MTITTQQPTEGFKAALSLIREFEGFVDHAYPDPASGGAPWTIGYGFTHLNGTAIQPGQTITLEKALAELEAKVQAYGEHLAQRIPYWEQMNTNQRSALLDFAWNLGLDFYGDQAGFATITRELEARNWQAVPQALLLYRDPGSAVEAGLLRRRRAEAALWQRPVSQPSNAHEETPATKKLPLPEADVKAENHFPNPLKVPYCDQELMADQEGYRECFSASSAMLAIFWGKEANENTYDQLRARYGDSTSSEVQLAALRSLGLEADFHTDGTPEKLKAEIDAGRPVAVGWLHHGPASAPSGGGHWIVIIGYDTNGFFVNDPEGNCDLVNGGYISQHDGAGLHYSYANWLPRWQVDGTGGWYLASADPKRNT
jgi:GH24 family phage-related lysozyme (muramidase)